MEDKMNEWDELQNRVQEQYDDENLIKAFLEELKLVKISSDVYQIYCGEDVIIRFVNCSRISKAFIEYMFEDQKEMIGEEGWCTKEIDMEEMIDDAVHENWWNWREEVKEYKGND